MIALILRRVLAGVAVMWVAATLTFAALRGVRGDPVAAVLGPGALVTPEVRAQIVSEYGFDQPLVVQYLRWLSRLVSGDLGWSYQLGQPVTEVLRGQLGPTAELAIAATITAVLAAVVLALLTAGRGRTTRSLASMAELSAVSVPTFWLGLVALTFFSFRWQLFPATGAGSLSALILPAVVLAVPVAGVLTQVLREGLETALAQPFALSVRMRGIGPVALIGRHALRHACIALATMTGWVLGSLFGGAVLTETVFARPGLGRVLLSAITSRDLPVVTAVVLLVAAAFTVINLLVDLAYLAIDPRLRRRTA
ncbi:ABC transporter permease [Micromonospora arborensis]|uniref:ABC transporter permease n=1 Tax=Micromonospora arborensis TaxID=2116518 RepID=UPI0034338CF7